MSSLTNTAIFEDIADKWDIVKCNNGVGVFELTYEGENTGDTFDTEDECWHFIKHQVYSEFEARCEWDSWDCDSLYTDHTPPNLPL